jgi:hypothetical protein
MQTSTIAFALIVGFVVFVTVRGELPKYLGVIGLGSQAVQAVQAPSSSTGNSGGNSALGAVIGKLPSLLGG